MKPQLQFTPLRDLCENFRQDIVDGPFGSNLKRQDYCTYGIPVLKIQNIKSFGIVLKKMDYVRNAKYVELKRHSYQNGDIILTKLGDPLGASAIVENIDDGLIVADLVRIRANKINTRYLCYHLNSPVTSEYINSQQKGTTRPRVRIENVRDLPIYTPSLTEQNRIVAILDEAFSGIARAKEIAAKNLANAVGLFESYLQDAIANDTWPQHSMQDLCQIINGYAFSSGDFKPTNTIKSIKITNVGVKEFIEEEDNFLPEKYRQQLPDVRVKEGNIVIALTRTIISSGLKVAVVPKSYDGALVNQRVAALVPNEKRIDINYLYFYLTTNTVVKYVLEHVNTLMQPNLSINDLKEMPVHCPPLGQQKGIIQKLKALHGNVENLSSIYRKKQASLEELKKSLLHQAFSGAL
jgi:type I restriction enzyme, S subunit